MKINQMIRQKRKELLLTQEQIADYLGVSTPAANKMMRTIMQICMKPLLVSFVFQNGCTIMPTCNLL